MAKSKDLVAAEARVAELKAAIKAAEDDNAARLEAVAPAKAKYARIEKAQRKVLLLTTAAGEPNSRGGAVNLITLADIGLGWHSNSLGKPKVVATNLMSGDLKVQRRTSSVPYTLRGMLQRTRLPAGPATVKAINAAVRRREAAERALDRAWANEKAVRNEAFETGIKVEVEPTATALALRLTVDEGTRVDRDHEINQRAQDATYKLRDAEQHLAFIKSKSPDKDVCPCQACQGDRATAKRIEQKNRELDELTESGMFLCPGHEPAQRHRGPFQRLEIRLTPAIKAGLVKQDPRLADLLPLPERAWEDPLLDMPAAWCRKGKGPQAYARIPELIAELQKAAKAKAREVAAQEKVNEAARKAAEKARLRAQHTKVIVPTATGDGLNWICPSCGNEDEFDPEVSEDPDDNGAAFVECHYCGTELDADVVKTVARKEAA